MKRYLSTDMRLLLAIIYDSAGKMGISRDTSLKFTKIRRAARILSSSERFVG